MLPYLVLGVVVSYTGAVILEKPSLDEKKRKAVLLITLLLVFSELYFLKYSNFIYYTDSIFGDIFSVNMGVRKVSIIAPPGISYYTLSIVGYVLDVYWKKVPVQKNICKHFLFSSYFPQITSGPITRYGDMASQLYRGNIFSLNNIRFGLQRMLWGYFKKLVIADKISIIVSSIYAGGTDVDGVLILMAIILFAIQLYCDFSGCMDIIMGTSKLFGIDLPENFNAPFLSRTFPEYWRRWHITLGLWSKDYILYPLLKSRFMQKLGVSSKRLLGKKIGKKVPTYLGLIILWTFIGFWHGGNYKYLLVSGLLPGIYLIISDAISPLFTSISHRIKLNVDNPFFRIFQSLRTVLLVCTCWAFIPATSLTAGTNLIDNIFSNFNFSGIISILNYGLDELDLLVIIVGFFVVMLVDIVEYKSDTKIYIWLSNKKIVIQFIVLYLILFATFFLAQYGSDVSGGNFIYENF